MDDDYFFIAARYIERNPVRAGLSISKKPWDDPWSSAAFRTYVKRKNPLMRSSLEFPKPKEWRELLQYEFDGISPTFLQIASNPQKSPEIRRVAD